MSKESEIIECALNKIIFQNDNGFIIGAFTDHQGNKLSCLGNMVNPQIDMDYVLTGYYEDSHKFGEQFKFSIYETILPIDANGIFKYITRICKWVGSTVGNAIVDKYGDQTLQIMKTDPERLSKEISGITFSRAHEIQATLLNNEVNEKVMVELESLLDVPGMRKSLSGDLIRDYKSQAAEAIKGNPYILTSFHGIGFPLADRVALNIGYARDSIERKKAAAMHCIKQNMQEGSTWISTEKFINEIQILIQVPNLADGVHALISDEILVNDGDFFALAGPADDEEYIAGVVAAMEVMV